MIGIEDVSAIKGMEMLNKKNRADKYTYKI